MLNTSFSGCQCWYSFKNKIPFPGAKAITDFLCTFWSVLFFFLTLKECIPDMFDVIYSDKI